MTVLEPIKNLSSGGAAFVLVDQRFSGRYGSLVFQSMLYGFRPYIVRLGLLFVLGLMGRASFLATAWFAGRWADARLASGAAVNAALDQRYLLSMAACATMGLLLSVLYRVPLTRVGVQSASRLYDAVIHHTSMLPQSFFDRTPVGRLVSRFSSDYGAVLRMAGGPLGEILSLVMDLLLLSLALVFVNTLLASVVVLNIAMNLSVYFVQRRDLRQSRRDLSLTRGPCVAHFAETAQGYAAVKLYGKAVSFGQRFLEHLDVHLASRVRSVYFMQRFSFWLVVVTSLSLVVTAALGLWLSSKGAMTLGELAVSFTFVAWLSVSTQQFFDYLGRFDEALTGVERLGEYLALAPEPGSSDVSGKPVAHGSIKVVNEEQRNETGPKDSSVGVHGLKMRYAADGPCVLGSDNGLTFGVLPQEKFGIVGRTGSGKSSIVNALFYLYPFESGLITACGGAPAHALATPGAYRPMTLAAYRAQMSLIAQDPVLFRGTLADNLFVPGRTLSDAEMEEALVAVGLGDWVRSLDPLGSSGSRLRRPVHEGGLNLSAGQRQLVCMARALLEDAPILVMDEATSAVDPRSEDQLMTAASMALGHRTQIRIAHRLSTLQDCDRILWLDQGRIRMLDKADLVLKNVTLRGAGHGRDS
jgi:ABC-type multidrug transport system fused ATPase/permease subunit